MAKYFVIILIFILGCATNPYTGKKSLLLTSESDEIAQGEQLYSQILRKEPIIHNRRSKIVKEVGQRIAAASGRTDYDWQFNLINKNIPNAFCLPGGKIAFYDGMLNVAQNEAALAAIMGHEVAHALARHGGQRISQHMILNGLITAGALISAHKIKDQSTRKLLMAAIGAGATIGVILPFSRSHEVEADIIGLKLMAIAGYDPREAVSLWQRMETLDKGPKQPAFLSTHPRSKKRYQILEREIPKIWPLYVKSAKRGKGRKL